MYLMTNKSNARKSFANMSINYSAPHKVDIPVTDLDDDFDDIVYQEQAHSGTLGSLVDALDDLDFDLEQPHDSWYYKLKGFFNRNEYDKVESYELRDTTDLNDFTISDEEFEPTNKAITDLKRKHFKGFIFLLTSLAVVVVLYFTKFTGSTTAYLNYKNTVSNSTHDFYQTTIVVSLDGFHPHYVSPKLTPALHDMMMNQYGAPYMTPSFPSSTFPNHWTIVTGLYPSEHGIVGNTFYDPKLKKQFVNTNPKQGGLDPDFWQGGEPVWETAFKQGVNSAVHMWPGSEVPGVGIDNGPMAVDRYNGLELLSSKVDRVMGWLDEPDIKNRPQLILTYVPTIDLYGHQFGISGPNITNALTYVDNFVSLLRKELQSRNLTDIANLIILSDHGMAPTSNDRLLYLDDVVNMTKIEHVDGWPLFGLRPYKSYSVEDIYNELTTNFGNQEEHIQNNFDIYKVEDLPEEWEFGGKTNKHNFNYRLAPIWVVPKVGYSVTTHDQMKEKNNDYTPKGVHGYNNTELLMRATFLAEGPYFSSILSEGNKMVKPFRNTEVYNLICQSLGITPAANNGTIKDGYMVPIISQQNVLPKDWTDSIVYPGLDYEVSHIVEDATYDLLWKPKKDNSEGMKTIFMSSNPNPAESLISEESSLSANPDITLPKPSDFSEVHSGETSAADDSDASDSDKEDDKSPSLLDSLLDKINHIGDEIEDKLGDLTEDINDGAEQVEDYLDDFFESEKASEGEA